MGRNVQFQVVRGIAANMPSLGDGEFYFATDTAKLYVGLGGGALQIEANMGVNVSDPVVPTQIASVVPPGTAPLYLLAVKAAQDSDRIKKILTLTKGTSITSEALVTLTIKSGTATTTTGTSYTVTAGKTLRLQALLLSATAGTAAVTSVAIRLREGAAGGGAVTVTSDIISEVEVSANTATIGVSGQQALVFPDGLEVSGGQQIGISELASTVNAAVTIVLVGFEY